MIISHMASIPTCRHTRRLGVDEAAIAEAAAILEAGGLVAFPTETVYGLGAHALDATAVRGIFEAKRRPADDPLIVHLASVERVADVADVNALAHRLAVRFWPGPLTLVLDKRDVVPAEVTAGLGSVAVRVPAHPVAHALLEACGLPLAAPSANLFGRPSPTRAEHVLADLDGRIDAILDGGATDVGLESTIVELTGEPPRLLRAGGVPLEAIEAALGTSLEVVSRSVDGAQLAPGMLATHYAPRTPLVLVLGQAARDRLIAEVGSAHARVGVLALEEDRAELANAAHIEVVGTWTKPDVSAKRLFDALRNLDAARLDVIYARLLADPSKGLGRALADRLRRASQQVIDTEH